MPALYMKIPHPVLELLALHQSARFGKPPGRLSNNSETWAPDDLALRTPNWEGVLPPSCWHEHFFQVFSLILQRLSATWAERGRTSVSGGQQWGPAITDLPIQRARAVTLPRFEQEAKREAWKVTCAGFPPHKRILTISLAPSPNLRRILHARTARWLQAVSTRLL